MNKLEEYKINSAVDCAIRVKNIAHRAGVLVGYDEGFDAAIALDLPVKFSNWKDSKDQSWKEWARQAVLDDRYSVKAAYEYWRDNIYKPE